ncbi:MAG: glycosyltransferase family 2 protein [Elusimicrobia bacterium]|nr:glycosyltransferase family 2 protein [Elusimicrobiota bacterium]
MSSPPGLSVILPVLNQAVHIGEVVEGYRAVLLTLNVPFEMILVVNGSRDDSLAVCSGLAARFPDIVALESSPPGWGLAVRTGLARARGRLVCYTNSARTDPERLKKFVAYGLRNPGVVIKANRRRHKDSVYRRLGSLLFNVQCRALFDLPMWDVNGTPKVFPGELVPRLDLRFDDDLIDLEFNVRCNALEAEMLEVPVFFTRRHGGRSTTSWRSALKLYWGALRFWLRERRSRS